MIELSTPVRYDGQKRTSITGPTYGFELDIGAPKDSGLPYRKVAFIPKEVLEKGIVQGDTQFYSPYLLSVYGDTKPVNINDISFRKEDQKEEFLKDIEKLGFGTEGVLVPSQIITEDYQVVNPMGTWSYYRINDFTSNGLKIGPIIGALAEDGKMVYNVQASGQPGAYARATPEAIIGTYDIPGKKWYETPLGKVGIALGAATGLGALGIGPLAAGGAASGAAAGGAAGGIVGTPGVSTIFPVAAPVAPTVSTIAPIATAGGAALGAFTPAPGSLQAALPGMGVETAASAGGFTAAPGSFQAALPGLGIASAPSLAGNLATSSGISATDALRLANQARGLLGAGQNPVVPQQQGLPQGGRQGQGVDYSGLLSLLQLQAGTPGVSSLTQPAQLRQMYQTTLLPDVLSLLG